ncbi:Thioredoxin reductase [compost metagenome]
MQVWDSIIIGGGMAGLQGAIQLGRYEHRVLVIDSGYGRSTLCRRYHNILGWPDGISGEELRSLGRKQATALGVEFVQDEIIEAAINQHLNSESKQHQQSNKRFSLLGKSGRRYDGLTILLATGLLDRMPDLPGLKSCLGLTVYVCPDCDGYELKQKQTIVLGSGEVGARMCIQLQAWTDQIIYINHEDALVSDEAMSILKEKNITYVREEIERVRTIGDGLFQGVKLRNGQIIEGERGFIAFGENDVKSDLAKQLGVERHENKHVVTDPRSKMTNVPLVWAAGDVTVHAEQVTIAMGEGSQAAIWMHKALISSNQSQI